MTHEETNYIDARNDILKAINSIEKLTPCQRENLAKELLGTERVLILTSMMQQYFK